MTVVVRVTKQLVAVPTAPSGTAGAKGDPGSPGEGYSTRSAMAARASPALKDDVYLTEPGREGKFVVDAASSWTAAITADTAQGVFLTSSADATKVYRRVLDGTYQARWWGVVADNSTDNVTAIQAAIDAVHALGGGVLVFAPGIIKHSGLTWKNNVNARGAGCDSAAVLGTVLSYTGTGDGVQLNNPINTTTAANVTIEGITFKNQNRNAGKGCFADTGSSFLRFLRCGFLGSDRGLILDQSEVVDADECVFNGVASQTSLIWIVNGADRNVGGLTQFSNRITISRSQLNAASGTINILDDGGTAHAFRDNNYNGGLHHLRAAGVNGLTIDGGEWESASAENVIFDTTSNAGGGVGSCSPVLLNAPIIAPASGQHCMTFFSGGQITFIAPYFANTTATKVNGGNNCNSIFAIGVHNGGGGATFATMATNHFEVDHSTGTVLTNLPSCVGEIAAASVATPASGFQSLFIDSADHKLKRLDSSGTVTIIA